MDEEKIGSMNNPVRGKDPLKLGDAFLESVGATENGNPGLIFYRGSVFHWNEGRWEDHDVKWLEDQVLDWMRGLYIGSYDKESEEWTGVKYKLTSMSKMKDVVRAVLGVAEMRGGEFPRWLGEGNWDPEEIIAFEDVLLNVKTGETQPRDERWFDNTVLTVPYEPEAQCPRWMRCLDEWSGGEREWKELLQRMLGYCVLPHKKYGRWFLLWGKIRAGKGTIVEVLEVLIGSNGYLSCRLQDLKGDFALDGLQNARALVLAEMATLKGADAANVGSLIKCIVGRDKMPVNIKYMRQVKNVRMNCVPIVQSNEIPQLPNQGQGLSGKMVALPFQVSFVGREQMDLMRVLMGELPGIAAWVARGAMSLEAEEDSAKKWPMPAGTQEILDIYHLTNNPFDTFLEEFFVKDRTGFVSSTDLLAMWDLWAARHNVKLGIYTPHLPWKLETESSWDVRASRKGNGPRGLGGLSVKMQWAHMLKVDWRHDNDED